jgi:hypothetical protein
MHKSAYPGAINNAVRTQQKSMPLKLEAILLLLGFRPPRWPSCNQSMATQKTTTVAAQHLVDKGRGASRCKMIDADAERVRDANSAAHVRLRSSQSDAAASIVRDANTAARTVARSQLSDDRTYALRDADYVARGAVRYDARSAAAALAARMELDLQDQVSYSTEQLDWIYDNFERSPAAALAFISANTGIANTPADLGSLIDAVTEHCVAAFIRAHTRN